MLSKQRFCTIKPEKVKLGGLIGERFEQTIYNNLLSLDLANDFLNPFRTKDQRGEYIGLGKNLDALIRFNHYFFEPEISAQLDICLNALAESQSADGYIGMYVPECRFSKLWDLHETSYLILGLVSHYNYTGEQHSLNMAKRAANCILDNLTIEVINELNQTKSNNTSVNIGLATLGFEQAFLSLYKATSDSRYLEAVGLFGLYDWDLDIVLTRKDGIEGHAYAYFTRCLTQLELYELTKDRKLLSQTERLVDFLLHEGGMVITGACSVAECWHNDQSGTGNLGETCATAYYLRLLSKLMEMHGEGRYGDIMERVIYNALFAAQSPDGRQLRYYSPFEGDRKYWLKDTYCCPNNYRRIISELPEMICYHSENGIMINLYTESRLDVALKDGERVTLCQTTNYPENGAVEIELITDNKKVFTLSLRIPSWCTEFKLKINGNESNDYSLNNGIMAICREWQPNDKILFSLEMPFRVIKGFCKQEGKEAVLRGPLLFCFNPNLNPGIPLAELSAWSIDPKTFSVTYGNSHGSEKMICKVQASNGNRHEDMLLSQFADPDGKAVYFTTANPKIAINDELITLKDHSLWRKPEKSSGTDWDGT